MSKVNVFLTVDVEVWPVGVTGWPRTPLRSDDFRKRELDAYFLGNTPKGAYGLPYLLEVLQSNGLKATFFVDPMHSLALGIDMLRLIATLIETRGQYVGLHMHPEWLTDPRCGNLGTFRGPLLSDYPRAEQAQLIRIGWDRLLEADAHPVPAFRAGSWGADTRTFDVLRDFGIRFDSSLNAHYRHSLPDLAGRAHHHDAFATHGIVEVPVSRFDDRFAEGGKPLSVVGVSAAEVEFVLARARATGRADVALVLHSNEFVRTARIHRGGPGVRRIATARFERICRFLRDNQDDFVTIGVHEAIGSQYQTASSSSLPASSYARTLPRLVGQLLSRWH